jgi:hypothetical protein
VCESNLWANANSVIGEKRCTICGATKSFKEFPMKRREKSGSQRYDSRCRQCRSKRVRSPEGRELRRNYYRANREMIKRLVRESYLRHQGARLAQKAQYRALNGEGIKEAKQIAYCVDLKRSRQKIRESYARHADRRRADRRLYCREYPELVRQSNARATEKRRASGKLREAQRRYYVANKARLLAYEREYRRTNANRNVSCRLRGYLRKCVTNGKKTARTEQLLGCSFAGFVTHLERQFIPPMSWAAFLRGEIHIDHIVPCSRFDLSEPQQQRACFHYSNLQPLWASDNVRKGKRLDWRKL